MNKIYKTIRNRKNGSMVVVSELAKGNKKSLTGKLLALAVSTTLLTTTTAMATTTTIDVTENNQVISNHYNSTSNNPLIINFSDHDYTLFFKDISTTSAINVTDNNITLQVNGDSSKAGGNLIFKNNTNTNNGGAIHVTGKANSIIDLSSLNSISFINNISGSGGGIYSSSYSSFITLGDNATFTGNIADNNGSGNGGGVYSNSESTSASDSSYVTLGDNATFTENIAGNNGLGHGGGIYSASTSKTPGISSSYSSVILGDNATFTGNIAGKNSYGYGGGIYSSSSYSSVTLGSGAYFSSNRAGNGSASDGASYGGAIYSTHNVSLNGNSFFVGNLVGQSNNSQSKGGAIYLDGKPNALGTQNKNTAKLNADAGAIAFKNNYVNVEKDATSATTKDGISNSIYLNKNTVLDLTGNGNIYFDDPIYSGKEVGNNSLVKKGTGFVQFAGKNYLNTAGGKSVDIQKGTFRVVADASFETSSDGVFKVAEGATLAGGGTITAKEFNISGNISIDSAKFEIPEYDTVSHTFGMENTKIKDSEQTGNLTLVGDVNFENSAYFNVKVNPADENNKVNDLLSVEGTVQLGGATVRNVGYYGAKPNRSLENRTWTILKAESIDGKFSGVESVYAMLTGELGYTDDNKSVTLTLTRTLSFDSFAKTYNQNSVAGALGSLDSSSLVYGSITNIIGDDNSVRDAYDSLSGEIHAGLHGALMDGERHFASTMLDRLSGREFKKVMNNEIVTDKLDGQNYFWVTSNGFRSETDKTKGNAKAVFKGGGLTMGGESERDNLTLGGAFHYGHSDYKLDSRNSKADIDSFKVAGYGAYQMDSLRFKAGASYGFHQIDSKRYVSVTDEHVKTDYDMHTVQLFGEVANSFNFNIANSHQAVIEPYIGLGWNLSHSESFKEQGGNAALNSKAKNNDNVNSTIGGRFFYKPNATVSLGADLNWQHIYGVRHTESEFTIDGSDRFTIQGARLDRDSFGAKIDAGIQISPTVNLKAGYQGRLTGNSSYNGGFVSAEVKF